MPELLIIKHQSKEVQQSPEYQYLQSFNLLQARKTFDSVTEHFWSAGDSLPDLEAVAYVLVLGAENTLFTSAGLKQMKAALDRGASVCLPTLLSGFPPPPFAASWGRVYTLRRYEQREDTLDLAETLPSQLSQSHLPIALFRGKMLRRLVAQYGGDALFTETHLIDRLLYTIEVSYEGVYHEFIDYYGVVRDDILQFIPEGVQQVLEIGCAKGHTGRVIQEHFQCQVTGVEMNAAVAEEAAQNLAAVIVGDVMTTPIDGQFDAIVATELFEHLNTPEQFLTKMKTLLKPGGRIVLSVPNVGHYSVVADLLAGRWDYLPIGLLCYTHFRFFTRQTLDDWINRVGFASYQIIPQITELPDEFRNLAQMIESDLESLAAQGFYVILDT
ncbi:MAG: class I SAM-dependent methyltransferase [Chloroflexota bacterium]